MISEPLLQVRDARDERHRPLASLAIDHDLQAVFVFVHVAHSQVLEFTTSGTRVEGDSDERGVSWVPRALDHGENVVIPGQHLSRIRYRVVAVAGSRGNPLDALRVVVSVSRTTPENAQSRPVVVVGVFVVVRPVDPAHDVLCGLSIFESLRKPADVLSHPGAVPEKFVVAHIAVFRLEEIEAVTEAEQKLPVVVADLVGRFDSLSKTVEFIAGVFHCDTNPLRHEIFNLWCMSRPRLSVRNNVTSRSRSRI